MDMNEGSTLRRRWAEKGNPPCAHPKTVKERMQGVGNTMDDICTTCGQLFFNGQPVSAD